MGRRARVLVVALLAPVGACGRFGFGSLSQDAASAETAGPPDAPPSEDATVPDDAGPSTCPPGYVPVPPLEGYTVSLFCVAKYEMKDVGGTATSAAADRPWRVISRDQAIAACRGLGDHYDLIANAEWQTIARQVADTDWNWSSGIAYTGQLNQGHTDSVPNLPVAATDDDDDACFGTEQTCSGSVWDNQRRTNRLADGTVIWDLGGNSLEFMKDDYTLSTTMDYVSLFQGGGSRQTDFGNDQLCEAPDVVPHCGYGYGYTRDVGGTIARGGGLDWGETGGIFTVVQWFTPTQTDWNISFRCVYHP